MNNKYISVFILVILFSTSFLYSKDAKYSTSLNSSYLKNYFYDTKYIVTSPSRWEVTDYLKFGSIVSITSGLYFFDEDIREFFEENKPKTSDNIANVAEKFGNKYYISAFLASSYLSGYLFDNNKLTETALLGIESLIISAVFTHSLKQIFHRHRPYMNDGNKIFEGPFFSSNDEILSFPSGHSTSSFAVATIFANQYANDNLLLSTLIYSMATITTISRVYDDEHWASDVFIGATIGYFTGKTIYILNENRKDKLKSKLSLLPIYNNNSNSFGLNILYQF